MMTGLTAHAGEQNAVCFRQNCVATVVPVRNVAENVGRLCAVLWQSSNNQNVRGSVSVESWTCALLYATVPVPVVVLRAALINGHLPFTVSAPSRAPPPDDTRP